MDPVNKTLQNKDLLNQIFSFLPDTQDAINFHHLNKKTNTHLSSSFLYQKFFGTIEDEKVKQKLNTEETFKRAQRELLSYCGVQPNPDSKPSKNLTKFKHKNFLQRFKWILGFENEVDQKMKESFDIKLELLKATSSKSILQLKEKLAEFWRLEFSAKKYEESRLEERKNSQNTVISKIFFGCMNFLFGFIFDKSKTLMHAEGLLEKESETASAEIGQFESDNYEFKVVASRRLTSTSDQEDDKRVCFRSLTKTKISFLFKETESKDEYKESQTVFFYIDLARKPKIRPKYSVIEHNMDSYLTENNDDSKAKRSFYDKRCLQLSNLQFSIENQNSDRLLDQKITQIMVEMMIQNRNIDFVETSSNRNDLPILLMSGFDDCNMSDSYKKNQQMDYNRNLLPHEEPKNSKFEELKEKLLKAREQNSNNGKLFPAPKNYGGYDQLRLDKKNLDQEIVYYSLDNSGKSWTKIIEENPILNISAGVLPEYWSRQPNIEKD